MTKFIKYRGAAGLLCIFLLSAALSGCGAKYEKIMLPETENRIENTKENGMELEDAEGAKAADGTAIADFSSQTQVRTRAGRESVGEALYDIQESSVPAGSAGETDGEPLEENGIMVLEAAEPETEAEVQEAPVWNGRIVALDAGHQAKANPEKEPVGPGSETMKAKVEAGSVGIVTGLSEDKLTLSVAKKVEALLEAEGYRVVMIRESGDVNISNAERAKLANESGADIFVKLHANSLDTPSVYGTLSMCQTAQNPYNASQHAASYALSKRLTDAVCEATGFKNRGVQETDTMTGINWCQIPVSLVEMGFMSNPEEDQKLAQEEYQDLIAGGLVSGIDSYFAAFGGTQE